MRVTPNSPHYYQTSPRFAHTLIRIPPMSKEPTAESAPPDNRLGIAHAALHRLIRLAKKRFPDVHIRITPELQDLESLRSYKTPIKSSDYVIKTTNRTEEAKAKGAANAARRFIKDRLDRANIPCEMETTQEHRNRSIITEMDSLLYPNGTADKQ